MPRVEPISEKAQVAAEHGGVVDKVMATFGQIRGPHSILLHRPELDELALDLGNYFRNNSIVQSPEKELAIITGVREKDALYIWSAQVSAARRGGLSEDAIAAVKEKREDVSGLQQHEQEIITYVRQMVRKNRVDQPVYDALKDRYGEAWLIEMMMVVGYYGMLAGVVNSVELPAPPDGDVLPV
jgi:4-carboxymuconolactone decarboxylase